MLDDKIFTCAADGPVLRTGADAMDVLAETFADEVDLVVVPVERLDPDFFSLRTGLAGEILQKFVTYRRRLVVLGDITEHVAASTALRDLVRECNRGRQTWFVADTAELEARLSSG